MKILVTGGAGFIGSHFVRQVLAGAYPDSAGTDITVLDRFTYAGNVDNLPVDHPRLTVIAGDVCDAELLVDLLPGHDGVLHFAAESHVDRSIDGATEFVRTNVLGTQNLLDCCLRTGVRRVVHVSTDEVYGTIERGSWKEDHILEPNSPYAASKAASDLIARSYWRTHGLAVSVTRCSNNYGPHQYPEKVIPLFVTNLIDGHTVPLYGDGLNVRDWLHVDDHCRALHLVLRNGRAGEIYNIGGGTELNNRELTGRLLELCGAGWDRVVPVGDRKAHDRRYSVDHGKLADELGFTPQVPFEQGLADVVRWYRDNRWWWEPLKNRPAQAA
ncbi:MAG: dTDP-glucose 4,6-dehydratase [Labedaea sp.]